MNSQGKIYYFLICQESKASTPWGEWKEKSRPARFHFRRTLLRGHLEHQSDGCQTTRNRTRRLLPKGF